MKKLKTNYPAKMKNKLLPFLLLPCFMMISAGCDDMLRDNLVILDTVTKLEYSVSTRDVTFSENERVNLQSVIDDIDGDVENVNFFNITVYVSNIYNSSPETSISGQLRSRISGTSQSYTLVNFTNITFEDFFRETSIFSDDLAGLSVDPNGVEGLLTYFNQKPAPVVNFTVSGTINRAGGEERVEFDFVVRLHTQMDTDP